MEISFCFKLKGEERKGKKYRKDKDRVEMGKSRKMCRC